MKPVIHLVMSNGAVLFAYTHRVHADIHQRTITGAVIGEIEVLDQLHASASDDINVDEWDDEETPVITMSPDIVETRPSTPRAKAKSEPPADE